MSDNNDNLANLNKDTDADGLTDADEQNIYRTSAYLADSDSDGVSDNQEIQKKLIHFALKVKLVLNRVWIIVWITVVLRRII